MIVLLNVTDHIYYTGFNYTIDLIYVYMLDYAIPYLLVPVYVFFYSLRGSTTTTSRLPQSKIKERVRESSSSIKPCSNPRISLFEIKSAASMSSSMGGSIEIFNGEYMTGQELEELKKTCQGISDTNPEIKMTLLSTLEEKHETHINSDQDIDIYCEAQKMLANIHREFNLEFKNKAHFNLLSNKKKRVEVLKLLYLSDLVKPWGIKKNIINDKPAGLRIK